jgi:hypothetical protein
VGIVYDAGLLLALAAGCAIGALAVLAHYERAARRRWAYEREAAEGREIYAALGAYRRMRPGRAPGQRHSTGERGEASRPWPGKPILVAGICARTQRSLLSRRAGDALISLR